MKYHSLHLKTYNSKGWFFSATLIFEKRNLVNCIPTLPSAGYMINPLVYKHYKESSLENLVEVTIPLHEFKAVLQANGIDPTPILDHKPLRELPEKNTSRNTKGSNIKNSREHYEHNGISRSDFKRLCKCRGWNYEDFEETFAYWYNNKQRRYSKYYYKYRGD